MTKYAGYSIRRSRNNTVPQTAHCYGETRWRPTIAAQSERTTASVYERRFSGTIAPGEGIASCFAQIDLDGDPNATLPPQRAK